MPAHSQKISSSQVCARKCVMLDAQVSRRCPTLTLTALRAHLTPTHKQITPPPSLLILPRPGPVPSEALSHPAQHLPALHRLEGVGHALPQRATNRFWRRTCWLVALHRGACALPPHSLGLRSRGAASSPTPFKLCWRKAGEESAHTTSSQFLPSSFTPLAKSRCQGRMLGWQGRKLSGVRCGRGRSISYN